MSSEIATSSPGTKPARSIERIKVSSASSLLENAGHQPPSSARPCRRPRSAMIFACGMVDFRRDLERLGESFGARRHDHEILHVGSPPGVSAAAKNLDLGQRNDRRLVAETIKPERKPAARGRRMKNAERNGSQRVSSEPRLVRRSIEGDESSRRLRPDRTGRGPRGRARFRCECPAARPARQSRRSALPPSRLSIASREPRDAPAGAMPRPTAPSLNLISASTSGVRASPKCAARQAIG